MKKGFTLVETLIALTLIGFIAAIIIPNVGKITPDVDKAKVKKGYLSIERAVYELLNNETVYAGSEGFAALDPIVVKDIGETLGLNGPETKFNDAMKYFLNPIQDKIQCQLYPGMSSSTGCFKTDDGVVFGIADTDFQSTGTIKDDDIGYMTPIVFYPQWKEGSTVKENAAIVGVSKYGRIKIMKTSGTNCSSASAKEYIQCKVPEYLKSDTIKTKG